MIEVLKEQIKNELEIEYDKQIDNIIEQMKSTASRERNIIITKILDSIDIVQNQTLNDMKIEIVVRRVG